MARRRASVLSPLAMARRNAVRRGVIGGDRTWMVIGALVWGPRLLRRALGRNEQVIATETLAPGERLVLTTIAQRTRAERQALKRS